jgi:fucose permease
VLLTPLLVKQMLPRLGFRRTVGGFALVNLAPALLAALTPVDAYPAAMAEDLGRVVFDPVVVLAAATYFLFVPIEMTVRNWASAYLTQEGYSTPRATGWLTAFWISFLAGRLAAFWLVLNTGPSLRVEPWLLLGLVLLTAVALGNLAGAAGHYNAGWGLPVVGVVMGPILPTLIGIALHRFPSEPGTAFATVYGLGNLGALLLAPVIGPYTRGATAFRIPLMLALAATTATLALALLIR